MTSPIVRYPLPGGTDIAFWLNAEGVLCGWSSPDDEMSPEQAQEHGEGWRAGQLEAADCGTTLAAIRAKIEEARNE